jgi:RNA recognition motif-containing protein
MSNKLFVGGLSWDTSDDSLRTAFADFGEVTDAKVITDRDTGRSRGFGFVTFTNAGDAQSAIDGLDGRSLDGRSIRVNVAEDKRRGGGGGGGGGGRRW